MKKFAPLVTAIVLLLLGSQAIANPLLQESTIRDDFSSPGDWELSEGFDIEGDVLKLDISDSAEPYMQALRGDNAYDEFTAAVDVVSKAEGFYTYHIWFNTTSEGSGYAFSVTPSLGFFTIDIWEDGSFDQFLLANTFSDAIVRDGSNRMGLVVDNGVIRLYINGELVETINDDTFTEGAIFLGATATDPDVVPLVISFDNLIVSPAANPAMIEEQFADDATPEIAEASQNVLFNVPISPGGIEIFPAPDRSSGRLAAATGVFEPHVAGKDESGDWVYIYYFDGGWQMGWSRTSQLSLEASDLANLAVIDPQNPPEIPELEFSETALLPFGVGAPAASADEPADPGPSSDDSGDSAPADTAPEPPVAGGNNSPVIHSAQLSGACENMTLVVVWSDEDGDAIRFEHRRSPRGSVIPGLTQGFSGGGSTHVVPNLYCDSASCGGYLVVIDANGNESRPTLITVDC